MGFRVSLGFSRIRDLKPNGHLPQEIVDALKSKISQLMRLSYDEVDSLPKEKDFSLDVESKLAFTVYRESISEDKILVVVQMFISTWKSPRYFSFSGVGRIFADGFVIDRSGARFHAPDEYLYEFM